MFVGEEVRLEVGFTAARDKLARLAVGGGLLSASRDAYSRENAGLLRVGTAGVSKLIQVQVRELAWTGETATMAIRWQATGPGGALFPVLDADIRLAPAGAQRTSLTLSGSYRPPLGAVGQAMDRAVLHRIATTTVHNFLAQVAAQVGPQSAPR
jgi:hypothetical protein